jgi:glycosyltransferase involved in cell wall biosynthesis
MKAPVTAVVLTFNEERNLAACLESLSGWVSEMFVVDSGSTDSTRLVAELCGARVVTHPFETHARQWRWALAELPIHTDWILGLDADQRVTPELRHAITQVLTQPESATAVYGYFVARRQIFRGTWIRHGGYYPKYLLKLFHRGHVTVDERDLVDHHFEVDGAVGKIAGDLVEDNQNEAAIATWIAKHNRYAQLQARHELAARSAEAHVGLAALFGSPDRRVRWLKQLWRALPLFVRPCLYAIYRYVVRLGFLDGKQGFVFHVLQGFWYRLLVDINIDEIETARTLRGEDPAPRAAPAPVARPDAPVPAVLDRRPGSADAAR